MMSSGVIRLVNIYRGILFVRNFGTVRGYRVKSAGDRTQRTDRYLAKVYLPFYDGEDCTDDEYYSKNRAKVEVIVKQIVKFCNGVTWEYDLPIDKE